MPIREVLYTQEEPGPSKEMSDIQLSDPREITERPVVQTKREAQKEADEFLTLNQASRECGMSRGLFKKLMILCNFPVLNIGKKIILIRRSDLQRWIQIVRSIFE